MKRRVIRVPDSASSKNGSDASPTELLKYAYVRTSYGVLLYFVDQKDSPEPGAEEPSDAVNSIEEAA
jgi:hypothetical protein